MAQVDLVVTLNEEAMERQLAGEARYDIGGAVRSVPTAQVVSGEGTVSVHVNLNTMYNQRLRKAVSEFCVIDNHAELEPYGSVWR